MVELAAKAPGSRLLPTGQVHGVNRERKQSGMHGREREIGRVVLHDEDEVIDRR